MNLVEHLLIVLTEELAETQQAISKGLRFGLKDGYPGTDRTNEGDIAEEFAHAIAAMEMLEESGIIKRDRAHLMRVNEFKKAKVREYMEYARSTGSLLHNA